MRPELNNENTKLIMTSQATDATHRSLLSLKKQNPLSRVFSSVLPLER